MPELKGIAERINYRVQKICADLEPLPIQERLCIVGMINQMSELWVVNFKNEEQEKARAAKETSDREAKFGLRPQPAASPVTA